MQDTQPHILDHPIWYSLVGRHAEFATGNDQALRYQPDFFPGGAIAPDLTDPFAALSTQFAVGDSIGFFRSDDVQVEHDDWEVWFDVALVQMVCADLQGDVSTPGVELTAEHVPQMIELVELTEPGPFMSRTIELGAYRGIFEAGRLAAMAGERMKPDGYCEVSAICTHPDYRRRGYARSLTVQIARGIIERGEIPFLHVFHENESAIKLYESLGFHKRRKLSVTAVKRIR
jgi:ribosomal protein S18 acetylase RimI-like enzyme